MNDCIYTPHCLRSQCDLACPVRAEIGYWMSQCELKMNNRVLRADPSVIESTRKLIERNQNKVVSIQAKKPIDVGDMIAYCCICLYGQHKAFANGVYNLNFAEFMEESKRSWQSREEPESLQMVRLWYTNASYLIISHLDYVKFRDFESQTLLRIIQDKEKSGKTVFIVLPKGEPLVGEGPFFPRLQSKLKEVSIE